MKFRYTALCLIFLFGLFTLFKSPSDPDFGWHYKYGEYFVQNGQVLKDNIFSYTFTNYKWANSYWLSQTVLYITHRYLGHFGASLLLTTLLVLACMKISQVFAKHLKQGLFITFITSFLLFLELSANQVVSRPMYFSSLFLMLLLYILYLNTRFLWIFPLLFMVWANIHADFVIGLSILGLFLAQAIIKDFKNRRRLSWKYVLVGAGSISATVINPFGLKLWETLFKESHPYQFQHIAEWLPVSTNDLNYFAIYCFVVGIFVVSLIMYAKKLPTWYVLALGVYCIAAFRSQYFLRNAVILAIPAWVAFWSEPYEKVLSAFPIDNPKKFKVLFTSSLVLYLFIASSIFITEVRGSLDKSYMSEKYNYPSEAMKYVSDKNISGNILNYYGWGGYIIWNYPHVKTFIDGRMPSWREDDRSVFEEYMKAVESPKANQELVEKYNIHYVVYPVKGKLSTYLRADSRHWEEVYTDETAAVFVETASIDI